MQLRVEEISSIIKSQIENYDKPVGVVETGTVITVGDGIARVYGLAGAKAGELLEFPHNIVGMYADTSPAWVSMTGSAVSEPPPSFSDSFAARSSRRECR